MKNFYPNEKFSKAIDGMATSPASLQERIRDAYIYNIMYVKDKDVSEDIRFDLNQLHATLTAVPAEGDEGTVEATTRQLADHDAMEIARKILDLAGRVRADIEDQ